MTPSRGILFTFILVLGLGLSAPSLAIDESDQSVLMVVDVSGSMRGTPLVEAKAALRDTIASIPSSTAIGLRSFSGNCGDGGRSLVDVGLNNREELSAAVDALSAGGGTPTPDALRAAVSDLPSFGSRSIVLISDGDSSCGPACPVAQSLLEDEDLDFRVFTVGFNAPASAAADLTCIAEATGGQYFEASDQQSLSAAIGGAVGSPALTLRALPIESVIDAPIDDSFEIRVLVKVETPDGNDAVGAVVSVDGEIFGVTGAEGTTTVPISVDPFWRETHPDGKVEITATLGNLTGAIEEKVVHFDLGTSACSYDGPPRGGTSLGTYVSLMQPSAAGLPSIVEFARDLLDNGLAALEVFESTKKQDVETEVWGYVAEGGVYDSLYVAEVTVTSKSRPISSTYWLVSKSEGNIDFAPKDLFGTLAGNCFRIPDPA